MAQTLTVLKFDTPDGAEQALELMKSLQDQQLINVADAATVSWPQGAKKPKTKQAVGLKSIGALDGAFWGMLFGLIFFVPLLGMAIGAAVGALSASFMDIGISDKFIKETRDKVTPGTSALFLLTSNAVLDRVASQMKEHLPPFELIASNLSDDQQAKLEETFAEAK